MSALERLTRLRHSVDDISDAIRILEKDLREILYDSSDRASDASRPESPVMLQALKPPPLKTKRSRIIYVPVLVLSKSTLFCSDL
jgi:hypothetical protein